VNRLISRRAVLLVLAVVTPAAAQDAIVIPSALWFGQQPQSPAVPHPAGLDCALRQARHGNNPAVALFAAARAPARLVQVYGGRLNAAIQIVAVDTATGRVYSRPGERAGAAPLSEVMDRATPSFGAATVQSADTWLNCDLREHLGLPAVGADYTIFVWLDEMTSPARSTTLPAVSGSRSGPTPLAPSSMPGVEWLARTTEAPLPGSVALRSSGSNIEGAFDPSLLRGAGAVSLVALGYRNRNVRSAVIHTPSASATRFRADVAPLGVVNGRRGDAVFVVAVAGASVSNVLRLESRTVQAK
jgi:hypothetical protein